MLAFCLSVVMRLTSLFRFLGANNDPEVQCRGIDPCYVFCVVIMLLYCKLVDVCYNVKLLDANKHD